MNKRVLSIFFLMAFICGSCQLPAWNEKIPEETPVMRELSTDLEILKKYMQIDKETNQYSVCITEEERLSEGISEENLKYLLGNITTLNQSIAENVRKGNVVTLYLFKEDSFDSYTINKPINQEFDFKDSYVSTKEEEEKKQTRGQTLGYAYFSQGNWGSSKTYFEGSGHITSILAVDYSSGYWQVQFTCRTGTSAYGKSFIAYGTGHSHGSIKRYWWWTGGGHAPFYWDFILGGPPGGESYGTLSFVNT